MVYVYPPDTTHQVPDSTIKKLEMIITKIHGKDKQLQDIPGDNKSIINFHRGWNQVPERNNKLVGGGLTTHKVQIGIAGAILR